MYQNADRLVRDIIDPVFGVFYRDKGEDDRAFSAELQHLFSSKYIKTIFGIGYFHIDMEDQLLLSLLNLFPPPSFFAFPLLVPGDVRHTNLYLYSYINFLKNVTFTLGASGDLYKEQRPDKTFEHTNQFNPKFGITWNPFPDTTLRAAVFRVLKRTLITDQTLEPTQVAGFNQFFDEPNATKSWQYGVGVDQKFFKSIYGGAEFSYRDLDTQQTQGTAEGAIVNKFDWKESTARGYLYWTPHKWFGLSVEYLYERFKRDEGFALGAKDVTTNRVPLGINFYHPSGLSAMLKASYINQRGDFEPQFEAGTGTFVPGKDNFWLFDTAISYRLPKKYGFISVGVKNLFNRDFKFFDVDYFNPTIQPGRFIYGKITLALP
jgi:outer membrane receptor protein involved in Fe transport